ncbi:site-2 protease family protein [Patescibacteria group bacterium]|nr:site-2 protease family protein [Patescibacteria group bacterium]
MFILQFAILIYSVILHEISHGWVADRLGDPTARLSRRLTLNPLPHIDPVMTIALPLILIVTGSPVVFGAAKPVPIDPFNFRDPKKDTALTAAAGPVTNIIIALLFSIVLRISDIFIIDPALLSFIQSLCFYGVEINVVLAVFNLLPVPPLDGSKVLAGLLPDDLAAAFLSLERFGLLFIFIILFLFSGIINDIVLPITQTLLRLLLP